MSTAGRSLLYGPSVACVVWRSVFVHHVPRLKGRLAHYMGCDNTRDRLIDGPPTAPASIAPARSLGHGKHHPRKGDDRAGEAPVTARTGLLPCPCLGCGTWSRGVDPVHVVVVSRS